MCPEVETGFFFTNWTAFWMFTPGVLFLYFFYLIHVFSILKEFLASINLAVLV